MLVDVPGIPLRRRHDLVYALVDAADFVWLNEFRWGFKNGYAGRYTPDGVSRIYMHREIMGLLPGDGLEVDHRNGSKLDNRRSNLRIVTHAANCLNHPGYARTSRARGVSWDERRGGWRVQFKLGGVLASLGSFADEAEAIAVAAAYLSERGLARSAA